MTDDNKCAYRNCENTYTDEVPFYFPATDIKRRRIWLKNAGNDSLNNLTFKALEFRFLCAKHFPEKYINRKSSRTRLVKHAVPVHYMTGDIEPGDDPYKIPQDEGTTEVENVKYRKVFIKPSNKCLIKALVNHTEEAKNNKAKPLKINPKKFNSLKKSREMKIQYNSIQYQVPVRIAPKRIAEAQNDLDDTQKKISRTKEKEDKMATSCFGNATGILPAMPRLMPKINAFVPIAPKKGPAEYQKASEETKKKISERKKENTVTTSCFSYPTGILPTMPLLIPKLNTCVPIAPKKGPAEDQKDSEKTLRKFCKPKENTMTTSCFSYPTGILPTIPLLIPKINAFVPIAPKKGPAEDQKDSEETKKKNSKPKEENKMTTSCFSYSTGVLPTRQLVMPKMNTFVPIAPNKIPAEVQNDSVETKKTNCEPKGEENTRISLFFSHATRILRMLPPWLKVKAINEMLTVLTKYKLETKLLKPQENSADSLLTDIYLPPIKSKFSQSEKSNHSYIKPQIKLELEEPMIKTEHGFNEPETTFEIEVDGVAMKSEDINMISEPIDIQVKIEDEG